MKIDKLISQLQDLQTKGLTEIQIEFDSYVECFEVQECNVYRGCVVENIKETTYPEVTKDSLRSTGLSEESVDYYFDSFESQKRTDIIKLEKSSKMVVLRRLF